MHRKYSVLLSLPFLLAQNAMSCIAGTGDWQGSPTIAQSKKHKLFLGTATAEPNSIVWEGHKVTFGEIWLEHSVMRPSDWKELTESDWLCLKVEIDGKREFGSLRDEHSLEFVPADSSMFQSATYVDYPNATKTKIALLGRAGFPPGWKRHVIRMNSRIRPSELKVHLATAVFENGKSKIIPSEVHLIVHLPKSP